MRNRLSFLLVFGAFSFAAGHEDQTRIKLYCMYTPEYQALFKRYFLPSIKDDCELVVKEYPQECSTGIFRSDGWEKTMLRKLEMVREAIKEHWNNRVFVYSDIDIIFLSPFLETALACLGDNDFVIQQAWPLNKLCAGFFVMRGNEKTLKLITAASDLLLEKKCIDDQLAIQSALKTFQEGEIAWKFLPSKQFPNGRRVMKDWQYSIDSEIKLEDSIVLFHANCTKGIDNKYHFLDRIQNEFNKTLNFK